MTEIENILDVNRPDLIENPITVSDIQQLIINRETIHAQKIIFSSDDVQTPKFPYENGKKLEITQGDIIKDVKFFEHCSIFNNAMEKDGDQFSLNIITFPYVVVVTQACDLQQYQNNLISMIVLPVYREDDLLSAKHVNGLYKASEILKVTKHTNLTTEYKNIKNNQNPRYHYLDLYKTSLGSNMIIDFKHYFTVQVSYLEQHAKNNKVHSLGVLFRENVSHRFSFFLSRIGLPDENKSSIS